MLPTTRPIRTLAALAATAFAVPFGAARANASPKPASPAAPDVVVRPTEVRPGELFEVTVTGSDLQQVHAQLGIKRFSLFESGSGAVRGYGAVPMTAAAGPLGLRIEGRLGKAPFRRQVRLTVREREWDRRTLRVDARFTHPTRAQQARMKADLVSFSRAYAVPEGPPRFDSNFTSPRGDGVAVNCRFGERRVFNGVLQSRHQGLDLDGQIGEPIYAANDGIVRLVRNCFAAGNAVVLAHGGGLFTSYFHLSRFDVQPGQQVRRGDLLGHVGSTGRVTGPHLHLSARLHGVMVDPQALLAFDFFPQIGRCSAVSSAQ